MHYLGFRMTIFCSFFFIVLSAVVDDGGGGTTCDFEDFDWRHLARGHFGKWGII